MRAENLNRPLSLVEFTALMAMISAAIGFSIDSMLPAMREIAQELTPDAPNRAQLIIFGFFIGLGVGTLFSGPLADAYGRKTVIVCGAMIYCAGALLAWVAPTLEAMIAARVIQGLGMAGPRVATMAITRDLYSGRQMARVMSLTMTIFVLVPAVAPLIGSWIIALVGWRGIFLSFIIFSTITTLWLIFRQSETLDARTHRPLELATIGAGIREVASMPAVVTAIATLALAFSMLFTVISTSHQVFDHTFARGESFPYWFGIMTLLSAAGGFLNAKVVIRFGMQRVVMLAMLGQAGLAMLMTALVHSGLAQEVYFYVYLAWILSVFLTTGFSIGNLNALGMEPLGHLAGLGSSIISASATIGAVTVAAVGGIFFDGSPLSQTGTVALAALTGAWLMARLPQPDFANRARS